MWLDLDRDWQWESPSIPRPLDTGERLQRARKDKSGAYWELGKFGFSHNWLRVRLAQTRKPCRRSGSVGRASLNMIPDTA